MSALINRRIYPLHDPTARDAIVAKARRELAELGAACFPDFVEATALLRMQTEASSALPNAYRRDQNLGFNPKGRLAQARDADLAGWRSPYRMWGLGADMLPRDGAVHAIYRSSDLISLVVDALGLEALHPVADPLVSVNVTYMSAGDQHGWHFDDNDFVVSLMLQTPEAGGAFEFAPRATDVSVEQALKVLRGSSALTRTQAVEPGTLMLFQGREALHRVSPVVGSRLRIMALLSYHTTPGFMFSSQVRLNSLGRDIETGS
jgi:hypothetical protein